MTFDEAKKEIDEALDLIEYEDMANRVVEIIDSLKEEYAPTVEMTKEQKQILDSYREPGLYDGDYAFYAFYDEAHDYRLSLIDTGLFDNITEKQLMQAWLQPETIKIVD